ncbi:MAG TPA: EamA family transporter [Terriglobales bacterium]|nr:EamA family transporter [Terriglobales bacterium]
MQKTRHPLRGYLLIAAATLFWGGSATLGKAAFTGLFGAEAKPIDSLALAQARTTISLLILLPLVLFWKGSAGLRLPRRDAFLCVLLGVLGLAPSNFFYYYAIEKTSVATAIILQYVAPIWVLLYMVFRGFQRATALRVLAVLLAFVGSVMAIGVVATKLDAPYLTIVGLKLHWGGVIAAELAGISFAFYNIVGGVLVERHDRWKILVYALASVALFWMFVNPPWKIYAAHYSGGQWLFLTIFSITSMLLPFSCYFAGLQYLDPTRAIVTSCLEPVFAILFAATFVHEAVGWVQAVGIMIVLAATILVQMPDKVVPAHAAEHV